MSRTSDTVFVVNEPSCMNCGSPRSHGTCKCQHEHGDDVDDYEVENVYVENAGRPTPLGIPSYDYTEVVEQPVHEAASQFVNNYGEQESGAGIGMPSYDFQPAWDQPPAQEREPQFVTNIGGGIGLPSYHFEPAPQKTPWWDEQPVNNSCQDGKPTPLGIPTMEF